MGRTRTSTKPITEEQLTVKQPNKRNTKSKARLIDSSDSSDAASDMELSPKSKKRSIAEVMGSDDEEQQIRPKAKKSRVAAKPKSNKSKNKNINNTNVIFDEQLASDDDFQVSRKRVTRGATDSGDEVQFSVHEEEVTKGKRQGKNKTKVKRETMRVSEDEPMSDLQHFAASDDEHEWQDVQWDDAMPAVSEIKREIKDEIDIALQHEDASEASDEEDEDDNNKGKKKKREVRRASRAEKHQALELHRSHLLTLLAHAMHCSTLADDATLQASVLSLFEDSDISVEHDSEKEFLQCLTHLADWFVSTFTINQGSTAAAIDLTVESVKPTRGKKKVADDKLQALIDSCRTRKLDEQNAPIMFAALCRGLSLLTRVTQVLRPASHKPSVSDESAEPKRKKRPEYVVEGSTSWVEVYSSVVRKWIPVDPREGDVDKMHYEHSPPYVLAFTHKRVADVTPRYAHRWSVALKLRPADPSWFNNTLARLNAAAPAPPAPLREAERVDVEALAECQASEPAPTNQAGFRNHPRYCLASHIGRYEALIPGTEAAGHFKGTPYYLRDKVQPVHTVEKWLEEGKQVKVGSEPVKKMKKRVWRDWGKDEESDYFGLWQTEPFEPVEAVDGVVPKNKYGNVYLFTPDMLPHNTVHLNLPGLKRVCKMLSVDFAPAMLGWDKSGHPKPILEGVIVCAEHEAVLREAWAQDTERREKAREKKRVEAVLKRWAKLTRALVIKHRLHGHQGEDQRAVPAQGLKNKTKKQVTAEHVHQFPEAQYRYVEERDQWLKVCACGLEVVFEKL